MNNAIQHPLDIYLDLFSQHKTIQSFMIPNIGKNRFYNRHSLTVDFLSFGRVDFLDHCLLCDHGLHHHRQFGIPGIWSFRRQVVILDPEAPGKTINYSTRMRKIFDTPVGRSIYSKRMGTVEPVFGNIAGTKKLDNFTLRGKKKVNTQWLLYYMVHNIGKLQIFGGFP